MNSWYLRLPLELCLYFSFDCSGDKMDRDNGSLNLVEANIFCRIPSLKLMMTKSLQNQQGKSLHALTNYWKFWDAHGAKLGKINCWGMK